MPGTRSGLDARLAFALACSLLLGALPVLGAPTPRPVSPGAVESGSITEARCPTFSWAGLRGARGYEIAVFRVSTEAGAGEPELVTRASLPAEARSWTPAVGQCLERGGRYAWSVAVSVAEGREPLEWARAFLFEVEAPAQSDVGDETPRGRERPGLEPVGRERPLGDRPSLAERAPRREPRAAGPRAAQGGRPAVLRREALTSSTTGVTRVASAASTPTLGTPSLSVSANVELGAASNVFKDGEVFLWDDTALNTALGRKALSSAQLGADRNTAVGYYALENTTVGDRNVAVGAYALLGNTEGVLNTALGFGALILDTNGGANTAVGGFAMGSHAGIFNTAVGTYALEVGDGKANTAIGTYALRYNYGGYYNTAVGVVALATNTTGSYNVAVGEEALFDNDGGSHNTAVGVKSLFNNTSGSKNTAVGYYTLRDMTSGARNLALGYGSGFLATGFDNILISSPGSASADAAERDNVLRIGAATGTGDFELNRVYIHGIAGRTPGASPADVQIGTDGRLGVAVSSRTAKQDIRDVDPGLIERLLELRPVAFRYREHVAGDPDAPVEFGLVAEEVAEVFPELVTLDAEGRPQAVRYHLLTALLLGELQRQHALAEDLRTAYRDEIERERAFDARQQADLERLRARLDALESSSGHARRGRAPTAAATGR